MFLFKPIFQAANMEHMLAEKSSPHTTDPKFLSEEIQSETITDSKLFQSVSILPHER